MRKNKRISFWIIYRLFFAAAIFFLVLIIIAKVVVESGWDGKRRFTIAIDADPLLIFSLEPFTKQAALLLIPTDTMLDVPYGYNTYPAQAVYKLGTLDTNRSAGKLFTASLENTFGIVTEGFIAPVADKKLSFPQEKNKLLDIKKTYFSLAGSLAAILKLPDLSRTLTTNLDPADLARLWLAVRSLRSDQIDFIFMDQTGVLKEGKLADNSKVNILDKDQFDQLFGNKFEDKQVRVQNVSVEVVNATDKEKVATQFARLLKNLGANVVVKSTSSQKEEINCRITVLDKNLLSSIIVKRMEKFYRCMGVKDDVSTALSDIKITLGEKFLQ